MSKIKNLTEALAEIDRINAESEATKTGHDGAIAELNSKLEAVAKSNDANLARADKYEKEAKALEANLEAADGIIVEIRSSMESIGIKFGEGETPAQALSAHIEKVAAVKSQQQIAHLGGESPLPTGESNGERSPKGEDEKLEGLDRTRAEFKKQLSKL